MTSEVFNMEQGTPEWREVRRGIPTASCFKRIATSTGKASSSQDKFIYELLEEIRSPEDSWHGNRWTERGHELEPFARSEFQMDTGNLVEQVGFTRRSLAGWFIGCSPDGLLLNRSRGLEIKCRKGAIHLERLDVGILPADDKLQVHGSMIVTGCDQWHYYGYHPEYDDQLHVLAERDSFTNELENTLTKFVKRFRAKAHKLGVDLPQHLN